MASPTGIEWLDEILKAAEEVDEETIQPCFNRAALPGDQIIEEVDIQLKKLRGVAIKLLEQAFHKGREHARKHHIMIHDQPFCQKDKEEFMWLEFQAHRIDELFWVSFWHGIKSMPTNTIQIRDDWKIVTNALAESMESMLLPPERERGH